MKPFGEVVNHFREKCGISQRELARRVGVSASYLNEIERGVGKLPSAKIVKRLAQSLSVPVASFYDVVACERLRLPPDVTDLIRRHPETLDLLRTIDCYRLPRERIVALKQQIERGCVRAIILAAGKGRRMKEMTESLPKCLAIRLNGKTLLQTQIATLRKCGVFDIVVVRGYQGEKINYPGLRYVWNRDYEQNNILESLMTAKDELDGDVLVSYSDIWYEESVLTKLLRASQDIVIGVDIDWKDYYEGRKDHPIEEAENVVFDSHNRVIQIGKIAATGMEVHGEFIGMMKLTSRGCKVVKAHYERAKSLFDGKPFQRAQVFRSAYLTDLLQDMADLGVPIHCEMMGSKWKEIDTVEDFRNVKESLTVPNHGMKTRGVKR